MKKNQKMLVTYIVSFLLFPVAMTLILSIIQAVGELMDVSLITEQGGELTIHILL